MEAMDRLGHTMEERRQEVSREQYSLKERNQSGCSCRIGLEEHRMAVHKRVQVRMTEPERMMVQSTMDEVEEHSRHRLNRSWILRHPWLHDIHHNWAVMGANNSEQLVGNSLVE